ncbi:MAG: SGNH/GDSL hydrolase family protein [Actinomycetota bacterium]
MKTILCYGDSNTYGCKPVGFDILEEGITPGDLRYGRQQRWTGVLQRELGNGFKVIEEGLNGRTTVFDDPVEGKHKNGMPYLIPCLESHAPLDYVLLMLGTNDLKKRFSVSPYDIALGIGSLIDIIQASQAGPNGKGPEVLLMCPPPLGRITEFAQMFEDAEPKSRKLIQYFKKVASQKGCYFLEVGRIIKASNIDGIHYDAESHARLGKAVACYLKKNMVK